MCTKTYMSVIQYSIDIKINNKKLLKAGFSEQQYHKRPTGCCVLQPGGRRVYVHKVCMPLTLSTPTHLGHKGLLEWLVSICDWSPSPLAQAMDARGLNLHSHKLGRKGVKSKMTPLS